MPSSIHALGVLASALVVQSTTAQAQIRCALASPPDSSAFASAFVAEVLDTRRDWQSGTVGSSSYRLPLVQVSLRVLYGWRRTPLVDEENQGSGTLTLRMWPENDPQVSAAERVLVYMRPLLLQERRARDSTYLRLIDTGGLEILPCGLKLITDAVADLKVLGQPDWHAVVR